METRLISKSTGRWAAQVPPVVGVPDDLGIFQKITEMAAAEFQLVSESEDSSMASSKSNADSDESEAASEESSESDSEKSSEEDMEVEPLPLDLDTGEATFATS